MVVWVVYWRWAWGSVRVCGDRMVCKCMLLCGCVGGLGLCNFRTEGNRQDLLWMCLYIWIFLCLYGGLLMLLMDLSYSYLVFVCIPFVLVVLYASFMLYLIHFSAVAHFRIILCMKLTLKDTSWETLNVQVYIIYMHVCLY